ncbi:class I SAM-dependent methyltransferase [Parabacteroides sp. Marseille-P3160]|uniref:class I SAM-dependent methyltransferase n=1 Tax=Parabacteroides sp. Marseille-P3160 TaxID=1917887 RepID=UPI0009BAEAA1|nr:class I SAM-dependent methyltransferase [Parabacteroides sp. Marseille-P3160]
MEKVKAEKSWVSKTMLKRMLVVWLALILISILFYKITVVVIISGILSTLMLLMILFFSYAYYKLSPGGGDLQSQVSALATNKIDVKSTGRLLDIGCGSEILAVELAVKCPALKIQGIDYWGSMWGYSKEKCEKLAKDYNVSDRINFERASASSLPFKNESFEIVISNMVFHEVADAKDKREVIKEALRVLKKGGQFVFQDLLLSEKLYGKPNDLVRYVKDLSVESVSLEKAKEQISIPYLLNTPMFFRNAAILSGIK